MNENQTRVFFVVDAIENNEELYTTLEQAEHAYNELDVRKEDKPRLYIALVRNAFYEEDLDCWNYNDQINTFNIIKIIK
jgi:DNA polymerase II large subunit